ncbi:hypothetical protein BE61_04880 [Bradyrhizobium elkanii USDA 61]|nr:hypothetical protein BE61_04880 [Bradyrhizobium elkanii USDA 61]
MPWVVKECGRRGATGGDVVLADLVTRSSWCGVPLYIGMNVAIARWRTYSRARTRQSELPVP